MSPTLQASDCRFETTDAFGWNGFATKLEGFLLGEREFVEGSLVVSLSAPFGSGKTTFFQMWKNHLDSCRGTNADVPLCIQLNAWEDDYCGDPLLSLVDAIDRELSERIQDPKTVSRLNSVKEATRNLGWFMVGMANSAVSHWTGIDAVAAGELAEVKNAKRSQKPVAPDILNLFQSRKKALGRLKVALRSLFQERKQAVFILVDELDRCRPDFAIQYLETIKHIFDIEGFVFVIGVDLKQLENSARAMFGDGLNFPEYFRKFAHRNIRLPIPDEAGIRNLVNKYTDRYLDDSAPETPRRKSLLNLNNTRRALTELPYDFRLTPRQILEGFRILGHMTSVREKKSGDLYYHIANAVIFLVFLSFLKPEKFHEFQSGKVSLARLLEIISALPISKHREWWASVLTLSVDNCGNLKIEDIHAAFVKHGFAASEISVEQFQKDFARFTPDLGSWSSLGDLARRIQEVESFGK